MPDAIIALGESKRVVGKLRFESDGRRQHSQFAYDDAWLAAKDGFALAPGLPLRAGNFFASSRNDRRPAIFGCFSDAAPDSWGRALMTRALGGGLTEFDYLVLADDKTRQGALRFLGSDMQPLSKLTPSVPRLVDLDRLRALAAQFERDPAAAEEAARDLAGVAGSLGGARPKANVIDDRALWIAKFTSERDTKPVERAEIATLQLAAQCGLRVPEARLELRNSDRPIALIRRFDRRDQARIPYMSARTALDQEGDEPGFYSDLADVIRQISSSPKQDLLELWSRIVFTILVSNTDDHLKNHGFIYAGNDRWRLSPAFDINPSPSRHRILETGILRGRAMAASLDLALEAAAFFDLEEKDAKQVAARMAQVTMGTWQQALRDQGASPDEVRQFADAFEHDEAEKAAALT